MLLLSKTFEVITEESAENGDAESRGFEWKAVECSVREATRYLRHCEPSQWPITNPARVWFTEYGEADYRSGDVANYSFHFAHENKPHALRYWKAAIRAAGFKIYGE